MENKQTAVEWLDEQIQERVIAQDVVARKMIIEISMEDYMDIKRQAKEKEKEQIIEAAERWKGTNFAEQYYNETTQLGIGAVRVRFYLCDYDEDIWAILPVRVNKGDVFYMDCFVGEHEEKTLKPQTYEDMIEAILYCSSSIWGKDKNGVYQQVFLVERD